MPIMNILLRVALVVALLIGAVVGLTVVIGRGFQADIITYVTNSMGYGDVMLLDMGRELRQNLTQERSMDGAPLWSPDGERIAFTSTRDGSYAIYTMKHNGSDVRILTTNDGVNVPLYWTQDGQQIGFRSLVEGVSGVYETSSNGSPRIVLWFSAVLAHAEWARDGRQIAFVRNISEGGFHLYLVNADNVEGEARLITEVGGYFVDLSWSPDDSHIAIISGSGTSGGFEIDVIDVASGVRRRITTNSDYKAELDWSPDGERIIYSAQNNLGLYDLYVMDADGSNVRFVVDGSSPSWRPR
ncbi:MAG: PD40 domain-containing protein [Burkholderiales bacterium]|nr:PD40 domain-containing protein [Anaerolineae bacterium]